MIGYLFVYGLEIEMGTTVNEAGKKGGRRTLTKFGREFYVSIGRKGQKSLRCKYPNMAREWGRLGGRPRKNSLDDMGK
jgi:general stress protein YciG